MGDMDGLALAEIVQNISPDTRILLMTGTATPELEEAVKSSKLVGWVEKPFTSPHILNAVEQVIGQRVQ